MKLDEHAFSRIDDSSDQQALIGTIDRLRSSNGMQAIKRQASVLVAERGYRLLDVGCGAGDDVQMLAELVGPRGLVVGIDPSASMIDEARRRCDGRGLQVEFTTGVAERMPFEDGFFDACRAERVLQHAEDPQAALAEMIRVVRSGGQIAVTDTDWGAQALDSGNLDVTERMRRLQLQRGIRNPTIGRQLRRMFVEAGLQEIRTIPHVYVETDFEITGPVLRAAAERARQEGVLSEDEATGWIADLERRAADGLYFAAVLMFTVAARKP